MEHCFNITIAKTYGIEEAILLHNFHFWLIKNAANDKHFHDGLYWFYNSKKAFVELFPYMNETKIFRCIKKLEEAELLIKGNYNTNKWNKTNWYAMTLKGLKYMQENGYSCDVLLLPLQNDTFDSGKMNDGTLQSEQSNTDIYTDIYINKEKKEIVKTISKKNEDLDMSIVPSEFMECISEWLAYKREKRQIYKPKGFSTFVKCLIKDSENNPIVARAMIEKSMKSNYMGVFKLNKREMEELRTNIPSNKEELLLQRFYDTLSPSEEAEIYGIEDKYWFGELTEEQRKYWRNKYRQTMLNWIKAHNE